MATNAENIQTAIDNLIAKIATASGSTAPDYSIDGQTVSRSKYLTDLQMQLDKLMEMQAKIAGPVEVESLGH